MHSALAGRRIRERRGQLISRDLSLAIARSQAPSLDRDDVAQEAMIASWRAEQKGQPEVLAARRQVIDIVRTAAGTRRKNPRTFVPMDESLPQRETRSFEEIALRRLYLEMGWTQRQIAAAAKRSLWWVQERLSFYGITSRRWGRRSTALCSCGKPAYKRNDHGGRSGTRCRFHFLLAAAESVRRTRRKANYETSNPRTIAA